MFQRFLDCLHSFSCSDNGRVSSLVTGIVPFYLVLSIVPRTQCSYSLVCMKNPASLITPLPLWSTLSPKYFWQSLDVTSKNVSNGLSAFFVCHYVWAFAAITVLCHATAGNVHTPPLQTQPGSIFLVDLFKAATPGRCHCGYVGIPARSLAKTPREVFPLLTMSPLL